MALLALAPACGFSSSPGDNPGTVDTRPACFGSVVQICLPASAVPDKPRLLPNGSIDTDMTARGSLCDQNNNHKDAYCVVTGAGLTLPAGATLSAQGGKPLVLLSTAGIELSGAIDVSSHQSGGAQRHGAGADPLATDACPLATPPMMAAMGGGGAGASLGTPGGGGGNPGSGGGGGQAGSKLDAFPGALRGGCKGADGAANVGSVAAGGDGGGAIALIAVMPIHIDVAINASGGGGQGGVVGAANGGGGGGSGGMIVIDAPQLTFGPGARLWANGGSGGQGSSNLANGAPGRESGDPMTAASTVADALAGGAGASGAVGAGPGRTGGNLIIGIGGITLAGGGGGGGGGGFIHAPGLTGDAAISPPSSDPPAAP
jgi:hypothetical protein